jgi:hypothetical protein
MLKGFRLTDGTGAKIVHNTPITYTKNAQEDLFMTFVTSANKKKTSKTA